MIMLHIQYFLYSPRQGMSDSAPGLSRIQFVHKSMQFSKAISVTEIESDKLLVC
jgi:hypothetical protein